MKAICVYDDHTMPDVFIANIVGEKTFGDIILKRVSVRERFESFYCSFGSRDELFIFDHGWNYENLKKCLKKAGQGRPVIHIFSSMIVRPWSPGARRCRCSSPPRSSVFAFSARSIP